MDRWEIQWQDSKGNWYHEFAPDRERRDQIMNRLGQKPARIIDHAPPCQQMTLQTDML